jgi:exopolysaccharide biosynthesis protein
MFRKHYFAIFYSILLTAFTVYMALDTFVITRVYAAAPSAETSTSADENNVSSQDNTSRSAVSTETAYQDENISITITEYREYDTSIYVADVRLSSPEYLKTALAQNVFGKNVTAKTSEMALANNAVLAINGDYYGAQENGYVLRNGVLYRDTAQKGQEDLVIYEDGSFEIIVEDQVAAQELLDKGAVQILSFGPALVTDSEISVTADEEVGKAKSSNPRTAIGVIDDLHYVFVVSDGRTDESEGLSLYQLAQFMSGLGVRTAYNLDGGGSSTMVFNGTVINTPTSTGKRSKERSVSDIVYIG